MPRPVREGTWLAGLWQGTPGWQNFHLDQVGVGQPPGPWWHSRGSAGPSTGALCASHTRLRPARASPCSTIGPVGIDSLVRWTHAADAILFSSACSIMSSRHSQSARCQHSSFLRHTRAVLRVPECLMSIEQGQSLKAEIHVFVQPRKNVCPFAVKMCLVAYSCRSVLAQAVRVCSKSAPEP